MSYLPQSIKNASDVKRSVTSNDITNLFFVIDDACSATKLTEDEMQIFCEAMRDYAKKKKLI